MAANIARRWRLWRARCLTCQVGSKLSGKYLVLNELRGNATSESLAIAVNRL